MIDGGAAVDAKVIDGGPAVDAKVIDGGTSTTPDARVIDASTAVFDAPPATIDAPGNTIDAAPTIDAPFVCPTNACGATITGTICAADGTVVTCTEDPDHAGCSVASAGVACDGGLVCAPATGTCACPTVDTGAAGGACSSPGAKVCEPPDANGESDVIVCTTVQVAGQACQQWQVFGGASNEDAEGNCKAAHLSCNATSLTCTCPVNNGSTFFANDSVDRTQASTRNIASTGVQNPAACTFATVGSAMAKASQLIAGTSNRATVVMSGGTPTAPAFFAEPPFTVPDRILLTVDTDTRANGIANPPGIPFDPRLEILEITPPNGSSATGLTLASGPGGGGQVYGFTVISGSCVTGANPVDCTDHSGTAVSMAAGAGADGNVANGTRARVASMLIEGGGGNIIGTSADFGPLALTATQDGTVTGVLTTDSDAAIQNIRSIAILPVAGDLSSLAFAGVYTLTSNPVQDPTGTWTFQFYTNVTTGVPASVANFLGTSAGAFNVGLAMNGTSGSVDLTKVENFNQAENSVGVRVFDTATPEAITGLNAYNNTTGVVVTGGVISIGDSGTVHSFVEHSFFDGIDVDTNVGKLPAPATSANVTITNASIFNSGSDGLDVDGAAVVTMNGGDCTHNSQAGAFIDGAGPPALAQTFTATSTVFTGNSVGVDVEAGNTTLVTVNANQNTGEGGVGLLVESEDSGQTTVTVTGGTFDSNNVGIGADTTDAVIHIDSAVGLASASSNNLQGLRANSGTLTITHTNFTGNGANSGTCESGTAHSEAVLLENSATAAIVTSAINSNNGGGLVVVDGANATITDTAVNLNGTAANECGEDFSGVVVANGSTLGFISAVSTVNTNAFNGIEVVEATVTSTAGAGFQAENNINAGVFNGGGVATLTATGTVTGNCGTGHSDTCAGIENHGTVTATGLTVSTNGTEGVRNYGIFNGTGLIIETNGADGFWNNSDAETNSSVTHSTISSNTGNGVDVVGTPVPGAAFTSDAAIGQWGLILDHNNVASNTLAGIALGGDADTLTLIENSSIGLNGGAGVSATGSATGAPHTGLTLVSNAIEQNSGSGLVVTSAFIKDATLFGSQFFPGLSLNVISHNGFPIPDNTCAAGETAAQIEFAGGDPRPEGAVDCQTQNTPDLCTSDAAIAARCIFVSATTGCRRAYQLNGFAGTCSQANTISGYQFHVSMGSQTSATAGVFATATTAGGPAFVNANDNNWPTTNLIAQADYVAEAGSTIVAAVKCSVAASCTQFTPPGTP